MTGVSFPPSGLKEFPNGLLNWSCDRGEDDGHGLLPRSKSTDSVWRVRAGTSRPENWSWGEHWQWTSPWRTSATGSEHGGDVCIKCDLEDTQFGRVCVTCLERRKAQCRWTPNSPKRHNVDVAFRMPLKSQIPRSGFRGKNKRPLRNTEKTSP